MMTTKQKGRYDEMCEKVKTELKARGAILIVIEGKHGSGCSMNTNLGDACVAVKALHMIADDLEREIKEKHPGVFEDVIHQAKAAGMSIGDGGSSYTPDSKSNLQNEIQEAIFAAARGRKDIPEA